MVKKSIRPKEIIRQRNRRTLTVTSVFLLAGLSYCGYWWQLHRNWVETDDAFINGHLIALNAQTEGTIVEILAENTQPVRQGQILVRLDGTKALIDLQHAQAELGETVRSLLALKARVETLKQQIVARKAALNQVRHDLRRFEAAAAEGAVSDQQVQNAHDEIRELTASIAAITAEKKGVEAQVLSQSIESHPSVEKSKSRLRRAYLEFHRRNIAAPVTGIVAKRRAQVGDQVKGGTILMVIVPMDDLWIDANFLETQIAEIKPGQPVEIRVDALGNETLYHGRVEGINPGTGSAFALFPADHSTGNFIHIAERVPVRIGLEKEELRRHPLQPGLSTLTRIDIGAKGKALLTSGVTTTGDAYRTHILDQELEGAEQLIDKIIADNQMGTND